MGGYGILSVRGDPDASKFGSILTALVLVLKARRAATWKRVGLTVSSSVAIALC